MTIEMEQEEIQDSNSTAPENIEEFRQQISAIKYDPDIGQLWPWPSLLHIVFGERMYWSDQYELIVDCLFPAL